MKKAKKHQDVAILYERNRVWVLGYFIKNTQDEELAADLSQTLWLKVFQLYETLEFTDEKAVRGYLSKMAYSILAEHYREYKRSEEIFVELSKLIESETGKNSIHEEAFPDNSSVYLRQILETLSEEEKFLIHLKFKRRLSSIEIAEIIKISPSLVRMRLSRLLGRLREEMEKMMNE